MRARCTAAVLLLPWLWSGCNGTAASGSTDGGIDLGSLADQALSPDQSLPPDQGPRSDMASVCSPGSSPFTRQLGGTGDKVLYGLAVDGSGSTAVAGRFSGNANIGGTMLTSAGGNDIFVAKYAADGTLLWARRYGGTGDDNAYALAVDGSGGVVIAGYFAATVDFGGGPLTSSGGEDVFVVKLSASGAHLWSRRYGSANDDEARGVVTDGSGNVVVTGSFTNTVDFGGGALTSLGSTDIFVAKYAANSGAHLWSKRLGGTDFDAGHGVAVDSGGNVLLAGEFYQTADFGGGPLTSAGVGDVFVAKYKSDGSYVWARRAGDVASDVAQSVAVDGSDNVLLTGSFNGSADFGGGPLTSAGGDDIFLASYSPAGAPRWSKRFGSTSTDDGYRVATDGSGNVLLSGSFHGQVDFGGGLQNATALLDAFVAKYNPSGTFQWVKHFGGTGSMDINSAFGVSADCAGNVIAGGYFTGTVDFGDGARTAMGILDGFLIKRGP
jgi:uncharacterized protein (AIM24 family)